MKYMFGINAVVMGSDLVIYVQMGLMRPQNVPWQMFVLPSIQINYKPKDSLAAVSLL